MKPFQLDAKEVRARANGHWFAIYRRLAPELGLAMDKIGRQVPCPRTGEGKTKFRLYKDAEVSGGGVHNHEGNFADGFAMLMWLRGWSFVETLHEVAECLGMDTGDNKDHHKTKPATPVIRSAPVLTAPRKPDELKTIEKLNTMWMGSLALDHPDAELGRRYLMERGITHFSPFVRFHPGTSYWVEGKPKSRCLGEFPAMVAKFYQLADVEGSGRIPVGIHRTYFDPEGGKLKMVDGLEVDAKKWTVLPEGWSYSGSAIHLDELGESEILAVAEGIETAMSVRQVYKIPTWATASADMMAALVIPRRVKVLVIFADRDRSLKGEEVAKVLKRRALEQGVMARFYMPPFRIPDKEPKGIDWNDVLVSAGDQRFPSLASATAVEVLAA